MDYATDRGHQHCVLIMHEESGDAPLKIKGPSRGILSYSSWCCMFYTDNIVGSLSFSLALCLSFSFSASVSLSLFLFASRFLCLALCRSLFIYRSLSLALSLSLYLTHPLFVPSLILFFLHFSILYHYKGLSSFSPVDTSKQPAASSNELVLSDGSPSEVCSLFKTILQTFHW